MTDQLTEEVKKDLDDPTEENLHDLYHELANDASLYGGKTSPAWQQQLDKINADPSIQAVLPKGFQIVDTQTDNAVPNDPTQSGRIVLQNKQTGEKEYINNNGTVTNDKGQVMEVMYGDGANKQFEYDDKGQVKKVVDTNSQGTTTWSKGEDGKWHGTDKDGKPLAFTSDANVTVDPKTGDYQIKYPNGKSEVYHQDGSSVVDNADGSRETRDKLGRTTELRDVNGHRISYQYTTDGHDPTTVKIDEDTPNEVIFTRDKNANGTYTKWQGGKQVESGMPIEFRDNGEMVVSDPAKHTTQTYRADGSVTERDSHNNITSIKSGDGSERKFEYNADGTQLVGVSDKQGQWTKQGDEWVNKQTQQRAKSIEVDQNGNYIVKDDNGNTTYNYTNGDTTMVQPNGTSVTRASNGSVKEIHAANGDVWRLDASGETWTMSDKNGQPIAHTIEQPKVQPNGDITVDEGNGYQVRYNRDGSVVHSNKQGMQIDYPGGGSTSVVLGENGQATKVVDHGKTYTRTDGNVWIDENGNNVGTSVITVDQNGAIIVKQAKGTEVRLPNGTVQWLPNQTT